MKEAGRENRQENRMGTPTDDTFKRRTSRIDDLATPSDVTAAVAKAGCSGSSHMVLLEKCPHQVRVLDKVHRTHKRQIHLCIPKAHNLPHNIEIIKSTLVTLS